MRVTLAMFLPPSETATMFAHRIARFISEELRLPIVHGRELADERPDLLLLCAGGVAFCSHLDAVAVAVERAQRIVWICNDHKTSVPSPTGKGQSPFRRAFATRAKRRLPHVEFWSTVREHAEYTPLSSLVCWNKLAYRAPIDPPRSRSRSLIYYGSYREGRLDALDQYLLEPLVPTYISNASGRFVERYPLCTHVSSLPQQTLQDELSRYGAGLYVEDDASATKFTEPPACRFYEMLSSSLPMMFQAHTTQQGGTISRAGYDAADYAVDNAIEVALRMRQRHHIRDAQREWRRDYRDEVRADLSRAWRKMKRGMQ